jgi:hypothetical protein
MDNCQPITELVSSDSEFGSSVTNYRITVKTVFSLQEFSLNFLREICVVLELTLMYLSKFSEKTEIQDNVPLTTPLTISKEAVSMSLVSNPSISANSPKSASE